MIKIILVNRKKERKKEEKEEKWYYACKMIKLIKGSKHGEVHC